MANAQKPKFNSAWERNQAKIHEIIFEADTWAGKLFDIILLIAILGSVLVVMLESVDEVSDPAKGGHWGTELFVAEWIFTILFSLEYILRILAVKKPMRYILSFYGVIDLLSIVPTYLALLFTGTHYLAVIRSLRLLRIFRVFKLGKYLRQAQMLTDALKASRPKIVVFLGALLTLVLILGSIMYLVEGDADSGFDSIPRSIYWAIVTLTTVGYGDIAPITAFGQFIAAIVMIMGYAIIAVPTGMVSVELATASHIVKHPPISTQSCPSCSAEGHEVDAAYCKDCGEKL